MMVIRENLRILFMGTPQFSVVTLEALIKNNYPVVAAFSQGDKIIGRKKKLEKSPVKIFSEKNNIPVFTPQKIDAEAVEVIRQLKINLIVLVAYGKILPKKFLDVPVYGAINIHPSLLPKFRGPSPVQNALLEGEKITGSTIMLMDAGMDTGDILRQKELTIDPTETYSELKSRLADFSAKLFLETMIDYLNQTITPQKQNSSQASYCKLIHREDGQINWQHSAESIFNQWRAFSPWPGIFTFWEENGKRIRLKLNRVSFSENQMAHLENGEVFFQEGNIGVKAESGIIWIQEIQMEGRLNMDATIFLRGYQNFIGSKLT